MRICLLTPYYLPIKGGITNYVFYLSKNLDEKNHISYVITNRGIKNSENVFVADTNKIFFIFKALLQIRKIRPEVLHSHAHWYVLAPCVVYKLLNPKTIVLYTFHTDPVEDIIGIKRILMKILLSRCDILTFVSKYLQNEILRNFNISNQTEVIYGGVTPLKINEKDGIEFKKKYDIENHFPIITFVGVLSWRRKVDGVRILIKAFKLLSNKIPESRLLIVGDGEYRKELEILTTELGIKSKVIFTGFVETPQIPLSITDFYTHITFQEGLGFTVLEAMSQGKTVIASRTGGIPEIINDRINGFLVEPNDIAISNLIIELINSKEKIDFISSNAQRTIKEKFVWSKITDNILKIYQNLIDRKDS